MFAGQFPRQDDPTAANPLKQGNVKRYPELSPGALDNPDRLSVGNLEMKEKKKNERFP